MEITNHYAVNDRKGWKYMKKTMMALTAFLLVFTSGITANAEETESTTFSNEATITFVAGDEITDPILPPEGGGESGTGDKGALTFDVVPVLYFGGNHSIKSKTQQFGLAPRKNSNGVWVTQPNVQVTDNRGTNEAWSVSLKLGEFISQDGNHKLDNVKIDFKNGVLQEGSQVATDNRVSLNDPISVKSGDVSATTIMSTAGAPGTWVAVWRNALSGDQVNENIMMTVDTTNARATEYTAIADWVLLTEQP